MNRRSVNASLKFVGLIAAMALSACGPAAPGEEESIGSATAGLSVASSNDPIPAKNGTPIPDGPKVAVAGLPASNPLIFLVFGGQLAGDSSGSSNDPIPAHVNTVTPSTGNPNSGPVGPSGDRNPTR